MFKPKFLTKKIGDSDGIGKKWPQPTTPQLTTPQLTTPQLSIPPLSTVLHTVLVSFWGSRSLSLIKFHSIDNNG